MAVFVYNCPHCGASRMTFTCHGSRHATDTNTQWTWNTLFVCRNCEEGVVAKFQTQSTSSDPQNCNGDPRAAGFMLVNVHPSPAQLEAPRHVSSELAEDYIEGLKNLRDRRFKSAGMMFRRVLDIATKSLAPDKKDVSLYRRIVHLEKEGKITAELRGLADRIRLDGNEANHEEEFDGTKVTQLKEFTYLFLLYSFSLPKLVELAQANATQNKGVPNP